MASSEPEHVAGAEGESAKLIPWPTGGGGKVASEEVITQFVGNVKTKGGGMGGPKGGVGRPVVPGMAKAGLGMGAVGAHLQQLPSPNDPRATRLWRTILCCLRPPCEDEYGAGSTSSNSEPIQRPIRRPIVPPKRPTHCVMPPMRAEDIGKKTLVLDLDETLVHSSFKPIPNPDYIIPVEIDNRITDVYVLKRPWVDEFMKAMGEKFEVVVFTASLAKYADPLLDLLDPHSIVRVRLFRDSCCPFEGNYVKDLSVLGRHLPHTIIIDNSPHSYVFHPENAVPISTFIDDPEDQELLDLIPYLNAIAEVDDVTLVLGNQQSGFIS